MAYGRIIRVTVSYTTRSATVLMTFVAVCVLCAPQSARAQCATSPNGGVLQSGGAPCTVGPVTVDFGTAIDASNSANVTANGAVTAHGFGTGINATSNAIVTVNGPVTASGRGLSASNGGQIVANHIRLQNDSGGGAIAMIADNATILANGITVIWSNGGGQSLVQSMAGGLIRFTTGSSLTILGGGFPSALLANGAGSHIIADGLSLSMGGSGGTTAAKAQAGGNIQLTSGSITFSGGGGNIGLSATGANSSITADGVNIMVGTGGNDVGANAETGGHVTLTGGSVSIRGVGGGEDGLRATGAGSLITASNVAINVTGSGGNAGAHAVNGAGIETTGGSVSVGNGAGGLLQNGGSVTMAATNVTASGNGGFGFLFNNGGNANTLGYSNGTITASSASFSVQGAAANIGLTNTTATSNNNTLLDTNSGNTIFDAHGSTLRGVITTTTNSTSAVTLEQNTIWSMTGNSTATTVTNSASQIVYTTPTGDPTQLSSYKTLTVGNYVGAGGQIALNTYLGTDGSPSDRLVIDGGAASGTTRMSFTDTGGGGALTSGDGILVVDATRGTTEPRAFAGFAAAGPYDYLLFRSGSTPGSESDWFLRSNLQPGPGPGPNPEPPGPGPGPNPEPPAPPGPPVPRYRQEVSLYAAMPVLATIYGRNMIDTLHERIGGDAQLLGPGKHDSPDGMWGRIIGYQGHHDGDPVGIYGRDGPAFDYDFGAIQSGLDLYRNEYTNGQRDNAGLYLAVGRANADVEHNILGRTFRGGEDKFNAVSVGGYWTRFGENNWYLDGVLQGTWYDMDMTARRGLRDGKTNGFGFAASLEGGYPFSIGNDWLLEPQAQIIYQTLNINDFNDGAADVGYSNTNSFDGRIGARVARDWDVEGDPTRKFTLWLRADLWHEFLGDPTTEFSSAHGAVPFTADLGGSWATLGIGAATQISDATSLYGNINYQTSLNGNADAWEGKVGLKVRW